MSDEELNNEVANVMRDGAIRLVDHAKEQWMSDAYVKRGDPDGEAMRQANITRWNEIRRRIPSKKELVTMLQGISNPSG